VTPGDVVDYERIRADIVALGERYNIQEIRFDPWNATQLTTALSEQDGHTLTKMRQGFVSLSAPTKELERAVLGRTLAHDGNAILRWMVGNVVLSQDAAGNVKLNKAKSTGRIDGVAAAVMALAGALAESPASVYQGRGLIAL
jgi:phage terminase large subunit-like protein